jgi:predicted amidohydrolase YtcJ
MHAAVYRRTDEGRILGTEDALNPEQALALFLGELEYPAKPRRVAIGAAADLCLLDRPWAQARTHLRNSCVRATLRAGELIYDRVDQPPL